MTFPEQGGKGRSGFEEAGETGLGAGMPEGGKLGGCRLK